MVDNKVPIIYLSGEELNTFSKETIITLYVQLTSSFQILADQNEKLIKQVADLQESVAILANHRFGRHTEKSSEILCNKSECNSINNMNLSISLCRFNESWIY